VEVNRPDRASAAQPVEVPPTSAAATTAAAPQPIRVTLGGDSQAFLVAKDTTEDGLAPGVQLSAWATIGCGLGSAPTFSDGRELPYVGGACDSWPDGWRATVTKAEPDVVLVLTGPWEVGDVVVGGQVLTVGTPEHDAWLRGRYEVAMQEAGASGAPVAVLDLPCYVARSGELTLQAERNDPVRVAHVNAVLQEVVAEAGQHLVRLSDWVCPGGVERTGADGQPLRYDGVHLTAEGVQDFWAWLTPILREVAQPG